MRIAVVEGELTRLDGDRLLGILRGDLFDTHHAISGVAPREPCATCVTCATWRDCHGCTANNGRGQSKETKMGTTNLNDIQNSIEDVNDKDG